jgi:tetratricopeptide (TPR) repeat protein
MKKMLRIIFVLVLPLQMFAQQTTDELKETARLFQRQGDFSNAILVFNKALQQKPNDLEIMRDMAYTYYLQRDYAKALETIKPLLSREDADIMTFQIGGNVYKALEEVKDCEKMYKTALKKFPSSGALHSELGELYWAKKNATDAIAEWEKGIQLDPAFPSNYYHAAKYYYAIADKVWSLIYGEIFINTESYSARTSEIKTLLLESYKKFYTESDVFKQYNAQKKTPFEEAVLNTFKKFQSQASSGITPDALTAIRTRFVLDWFENSAAKFPHKLFDQWLYLVREGMFEAYNQWIFGPAVNVSEYQVWLNTHDEESKKFTYYQRNRVFKMPAGQFYGLAK